VGHPISAADIGATAMLTSTRCPVLDSSTLPTLPSWALQQVDSFLRYIGRHANVVATAARGRVEMWRCWSCSTPDAAQVLRPALSAPRFRPFAPPPLSRRFYTVDFTKSATEPRQLQLLRSFERFRCWFVLITSIIPGGKDLGGTPRYVPPKPVPLTDCAAKTIRGMHHRASRSADRRKAPFPP
jgi:hypothetical protein